MSMPIRQDTLILDDATTFIGGLKMQSLLWLCPYGCYMEYDGSGVIFDRCYRPIARIKRGGEIEIVPSDEFISFRTQRWFHTGFGMSLDAATREIVTRIIAKYRLAPELRRRAALLRRGALPRWSGRRAAS